MKFVSYSALIVFTLLLGGCIPMVISDDEIPFKKKVNGRIQIGETSRDGVMEMSYCQKLCMGLSCGGPILAFSIDEFDASNDLGELI